MCACTNETHTHTRTHTHPRTYKKPLQIYLQVAMQGQENTHNHKAVANPHPTPAGWTVRYGHGLTVDCNYLQQLVGMWWQFTNNTVLSVRPTEQSTRDHNSPPMLSISNLGTVCVLRQAPASCATALSVFRSVLWLIRSLQEHEGWFSGDPLPVFSVQSHCEEVWHGQRLSLFDAVHTAYLDSVNCIIWLALCVCVCMLCVCV